MARIIVLDANVLIALLDASDAHHDWAVELLLAHADAEFSLSALTWAECLVHPARSGRLEEVIAQVSTLQLDIEEFAEVDAVQLATVRATHSLRMPDAIVLHTAMQRGAALATTDGALARAAAATGCEVFTLEVAEARAGAWSEA